MKLQILKPYPEKGVERLIPLIAFAAGVIAMMIAAVIGLLDCFTVNIVTNRWLILARVFVPGVVVAALGFIRPGVFLIPIFCAAWGAVLTAESAVAVMKFGGRAFLSYCVPLGLAGMAGSVLLLVLAVPAIARAHGKRMAYQKGFSEHIAET